MHDRRQFLRGASGFLAGLSAANLARPALALGSALGARSRGPHLAPRAKSVIFLFMYGGPSHIDTFDYKPELFRSDGKTVQVKTRGRGGPKNEGRVVGPKWRFQQYGECGKWVSDLFPHLAQRVDDIAFLHSLYSESPIHGSAMLMMNSGRLLSGNPCMGSWVNYGLGSENPDLPGFVVMLDRTGGPISGAKNWSSGYMPASYQGVVVRSQGSAILDLDPPAGMDRDLQRRMLDHLREVNERHHAEHPDDTELAARIASYELAYRMQDSAPEAFDWASEHEETRALYGLDVERTFDFGRKCLIARRLVERGVRFVQIYSGGAHNDDNWDAHGDLVLNHERHAGNTDKPIAGLLADLARRGLLEETLIVWDRRVRPPTHRRVRRGHRPRPQLLRLHELARRRRHQGRRLHRRNGRARLRRRHRPLPREAPARDHSHAPRPRPQSPELPLPRSGTATRRRGRCGADRARSGVTPPRADSSRIQCNHPGFHRVFLPASELASGASRNDALESVETAGAWFDGRRGGIDALGSRCASPVAPTRTRLLRSGWRRHGLIEIGSVATGGRVSSSE
jgi:hypothetical protein